MQDTITAAINPADEECAYLEGSRLDTLKKYYESGPLRLKAATQIGASIDSIVGDAVRESLLYGSTTTPGGNMYPCRRYAACLRDLEYFLRYATYAMLAADTSILDERVLNGLRETYRSLGVPVESSIQAIQAMKGVVAKHVGAEAGQEMDIYFDHIIAGLR